MSIVMENKFKVNEKEIDRRKKASLVLVICLTTGIFLALTFSPLPFEMAFLGALIIGIILYVLRILSLRPFKQLLSSCVAFDNGFLIKTLNGQSTKLKLFEITRVKTVFTSRGLIREVIIDGKNHRSLILDSLEQFDDCREFLLSHCNKEVKKIEVREPLDYDHPFFYALLGVVIGFFVPYAISFISSLDDAVQYLNFGLLTVTLSLGIFFIATSPITKRYGYKSRYVDLIIGSLFVITGALIVLLIRL